MDMTPTSVRVHPKMRRQASKQGKSRHISKTLIFHHEVTDSQTRSAHEEPTDRGYSFPRSSPAGGIQGKDQNQCEKNESSTMDLRGEGPKAGLIKV